MSVDNPKAEYILLVHTDSYAGNFERQMCAYMTGMTGECGVGESEADDFHSTMEERGYDPDMFDEYVAQEPDDHGCHRPASIWNATGEDGYKTVAIFFDDIPTPDMTVLLRDRAYEYAKKNKITVNKLSMIKRTVKVTEVEVKI